MTDCTQYLASESGYNQV